MNQAVAVNIKQIVLTNGTFGPQEIQQIADALSEDSSNHRVLREAVNELEAGEDRSPAAAVRLGVAQYLLGRYSLALETLKGGDGGALAHFYMGKSQAALEMFEPAVESFTAAAKAGYDADACNLARAESLRMAGHAQKGMGRIGPAAWRGRADGRIPVSTWRHRGRAAPQPGRSRHLVRTGHRSRSPALRRCSGWPWKTIAAATTKPRWIFTNARWPAIRPTSARS